MSLWGLKNAPYFVGDRSIASDCTSIASTIIRHELPKEILTTKSNKEMVELKHYRFKNSIWNKILSVKDFEKFDENEYYRLLEIYKDPNGVGQDLLSMNPKSIEQKLALIEAIEIKFSYFQKIPSIQNEIENLNIYKLKELQNLMKNFDLSSKITRENLEEFSSDFFLILRGPPFSLMNYFTKNKTTRMNERMLRILEEDMLAKGLRGIIERVPERENYNQIEKAHLYIKRLMKYKVTRFLAIPYDLPWMDQIKISDELLEKILTDGLETHQSEVVIELKRQNMIDQYEHFRKVYRPIAFGVGFYYYYQKYNNEYDLKEEKDNDKAKQKLIEDLEKISKSIRPDNEIENLREIQFQRVLKSYEERYHAPPTKDEYQELRQKIFGSQD